MLTEDYIKSNIIRNDEDENDDSMYGEIEDPHKQLNEMMKRRKMLDIRENVNQNFVDDSNKRHASPEHFHKQHFKLPKKQKNNENKAKIVNEDEFTSKFLNETTPL